MDALAVFALMLFVFGGISYALISSHMVAVEQKSIGNLSAKDTNSKYFWFYVLWCLPGGGYLKGTSNNQQFAGSLRARKSRRSCGRAGVSYLDH